MTTPKDTWISVKDAMPEDMQRVVVWCDSQAHVSIFSKEKRGPIFFTERFTYVFGNVTHWMLLSKPKTTN